ncbi:related to Abhydrolase domain-containing protein IMO32 [Saccharomycodes ludwigii]|uniref:Related to Abhydrolase domain-containing protein IMO32 n=1 Tax=Saccharomycodes ludwigii TaxID=36035 RepID=A0A376B6M0_9ASCO|nr:hypothetical protein SCDLUD_000749 [Saccharomycodes ludwigii]KAH3903136.1 hypothetical protein SCDLUD_000749 [Saccharomycodes ludwigii]SSD60333.1 related to Abhydrolase domain-containing protein IMO32 [Saccharomycodes ludwigii]
MNKRTFSLFSQSKLFITFNKKTVLNTANPPFFNRASQSCYSTGPLYTNHNNAAKTKTTQGVYGSTEVFNEDLCADNIQTVPLAYETHKYSDNSDELHSPLIVLHGLFGSKASNRTMARKLKETLKRNVYCLDLRNHGDSPHISRHDYPAMAADVERWIHDFGKSTFKKNKPIIVGHSMGAKCAMSVVLRKPNLCKMLCVIDNAPVATMPTIQFPRYVKQLLKIVHDPNVHTNKQCLEILDKVEKNPVVKNFLMTVLTKYKDPETGLIRYKSKIPLGILNDAITKGNISNWEFNSWIHRWNGPSLFIRGTKSSYCCDEYLVDVGRFFPNFEVFDIEGTHWVNTEKPDECASAITNFVERHEDL